MFIIFEYYNVIGSEHYSLVIFEYYNDIISEHYSLVIFEYYNVIISEHYRLVIFEFYFPHLWGAGWRLCLECVCEGIGVGSVFIGFRWRLDLRPMIMYAMT